MVSSPSRSHSADAMSGATHSTTAEGRPAIAGPWERARRIDPRYLIAFLITLVLLAAQLRYHMFGGYERLLVALAACMATEALLSWFDRGKIVNLQSAYISGISLTLRSEERRVGKECRSRWS